MIESNIPIPPPHSGRTIYPWATMNIGDSILVKAEFARKVRIAAGAYKTYHPGWNYTTQLQPDGQLRIWRIAPKD